MAGVQGAQGDSDKAYWHRYVPFYEQALRGLENVRSVVEFGVFRGASIRWLAERYPDATITGCDILAATPEWPRSPRIRYRELDQGSVPQLQELFAWLGEGLDLIIEDGSHLPVHQKNCLVEGVKHLRPGGIYVLEDLHTSHPDHELFRPHKKKIGPLHLLLALEHCLSTGKGLSAGTVDKLSTGSLFSRAEVGAIFERVGSIQIQRRGLLPLRCWKCGGSDYRFNLLQCSCGAPLYEAADSITAVIQVR